jgi:hypothetical protein
MGGLPDHGPYEKDEIQKWYTRRVKWKDAGDIASFTECETGLFWEDMAGLDYLDGNGVFVMKD